MTAISASGTANSFAISDNAVALVGQWMGDIEVVGLRTSDGSLYRPSAARTSRSHRARSSKSALTPTILAARIEDGPKSSTIVGRKPDRALLEPDIRPVGVTHQPVLSAEHPDLHSVRIEHARPRAERPSGDSRCSVMIERSAAAITPPLKQPIGVVMPRGPSSMRKPRGGRLLMMEKMIPLARSSATAAWARDVKTLVIGHQCAVDIRDHGRTFEWQRARAGHDDCPSSSPSTLRQRRPSRAKSSSASLGPELPAG